MKNNIKIAVIIPALNEEKTIGRVIDAVPSWVDRILVGNNGSTDGTAQEALKHGAVVVDEPFRGYGAACLAAVEALDSPGAPDAPGVVVFLDGDLSDDPKQMDTLVEPILERGFDLVIGSRVMGRCEPGALTVTQRFGNWLSCRLTRLFFGVSYTDLGPFRAVRRSALDALELNDRAFGWTIQMQVRAARKGLSITEVPVDYRNRRGGDSKVSGTLRGVIGAGTTILYIIFAEAIDARLERMREGFA